MSKCKRCGLPVKPDETEFSHRVCDEMSAEENETWLSPEELAEKAERIRQYKNRIQSGRQDAKK